MTPGLNLARASCAAASREGSMASSARSNGQAASREVDFAPAAVNSAAGAERASGKKVAIRLYFEIRCIGSRRKFGRALATVVLATVILATIILATIVQAMIIADRANPCPSGGPQGHLTSSSPPPQNIATPDQHAHSHSRDQPSTSL